MRSGRSIGKENTYPMTSPEGTRERAGVSHHELLRKEHEIRSTTMQALRRNPQDTKAIRQAARGKWRMLYEQQSTEPKEVEYLISVKDFDAVFGTIQHIMWSDIIGITIQPSLDATTSLTAQASDVYYAGYTEEGYKVERRAYEQGSRYDLFMRTMIDLQLEASHRFMQQVYRESDEKSALYTGTRFEKKRGYRQFYGGFADAITTLSQARDNWNEQLRAEGKPLVYKGYYSNPGDIIYNDAIEISHTIMEVLFNRKMAHQQGETVDQATMTRLALGDCDTLAMASHVIGKAFNKLTPWIHAWYQGEAYDPIAGFVQAPVLQEVESDDGSLPRVRYVHPSLRDGDAKVFGDCAGRFPLVSPEEDEERSVKTMFDSVKELVPGITLHLEDEHGGYDAVTLAMIGGIFVGQETLFQPGIQPVRYQNKPKNVNKVVPRSAGLL